MRSLKDQTIVVYKVKKVVLLFCFLVSFLVSLHSQNKLNTLKGQIIDAETSQPIEYVTFQMPELSLWATTDVTGSFNISGIKNGTYTYEISLLGYQKETGKVTIKDENTLLSIKLNPLSLALNDVVVTAQLRKNSSTSLIDQAAIQLLQPKSLDDLLQLLPGNVTKNPNLNSVAQAQIREITSNQNNALGTNVIVNGAPLSNDANLQALSTAKSGSSLNSQSASGGGVDLRIISADNIASVEVIKGIPSAEYGNLTSGVIIVKTKNGVTPWEAKAKLDANSKMVYVGKGFSLGEKAGTMNLSADYSQSYEDIRKKYNGFDRVTVNAGYSNTFLKSSSPLAFNVNIGYFRNLNQEKSDPQLNKEEKIRNENSGIRLNIDGNWRINKTLLSNLGYNFTASYSHQKDFQNKEIFLQTGITPISDSYISQEYQSRFQNASYYSAYTVDGKPINLYAQLKGDKLIQFSPDLFTTLKAGLEWKYDVNKGEGLTFDPLYPPTVNENQSVRPRAFKSIPAMNQLSSFIEDKTKIPIGTTTLIAQAGIRFTTLFIDKQANRDNIFMKEPRFNLEYTILNRENNSLFDNLSITSGFGLASKAPTLLYLYPEKAYFDATSLATFLGGDIDRSMCIMTTKVIDDTSNPALKPATTKKFELGISGNIHKISGNINFFYEKTENEFGFSSIPFIMNYKLYNIPSGVESLNYTNGMLYYYKDGVQTAATTTPDFFFYTYKRPSNLYETTKKGVEYSFNLGEIKALKTSLVVDGAWLYIKRLSTQAQYVQINSYYKGEKYPYMPIMPAGEGSINERINTNFRLITHIPKLKMIFSTTAQVIWKQSSQNIYEDKN